MITDMTDSERDKHQESHNRGLLMLELSDILWRAIHCAEPLSDRDRDILHEGMIFWDRVQEGASILASGRNLVPDIGPISAYRYATGGLDIEPTTMLHAGIAVTDVLARRREVLEKLLSGEWPTGQEFQEQAAEAMAYFGHLADRSLTGMVLGVPGVIDYLAVLPQALRAL